MKIEQLAAILGSAFLAVSGWLVGYFTAVRRDRLAKQRDLRTGYLIEAFRRLESAGNRLQPSREDELKLETAIADIQLLGSPKQVRLARQFAVEFANTRSASLDPLLESMRAELRKELGLGALDSGISSLRIDPRDPRVD